MKKYRDGVHLPLIAAIPAMLLLISLFTTPDCAFGREASPALREATDGGGDEWPNECVPPPRWYFHAASSGVRVRLPEIACHGRFEVAWPCGHDKGSAVTRRRTLHRIQNL